MHPAYVADLYMQEGRKVLMKADGKGGQGKRGGMGSHRKVDSMLTRGNQGKKEQRNE